MQRFKQQTRFFKRTLLAGGIDGNQHLLSGQNGRKSIHTTASRRADYAFLRVSA